MMDETIITAITSIISAALAAVFGYLQGKRKSDADANTAAFEGYNTALTNLRENFTNQIEDLKKQITQLQEENETLKSKIQSLTTS